jgi:hypothetical protein
MSRVLGILPVVLALVVFAGCTSMGHHHPAARQQHDFGPVETVNLCLYVDQGISEDEARALIDNAWRDEAQLYGIELRIVEVKQWSRPAFRMEGILQALRQEQLEAPCDRIFAMLNRHLGDFLWAFVGPEVLGAVNDETLTHGYAAARVGSFNQLMTPPLEVTRHEIYHLLGCGEHFDMTGCYAQIARLKEWKRASGGDFFPAWDLQKKQMLASRDAVNRRLEPWRRTSVAARQ